VLEAAIEAGVNLPYGCRNGACGACKGTVISGKVMHDDYQNSAMSAAELAAGQALFCCARPLEDLVITCRELNELNGIKPRILPVRVQKKEKLSHDVMVLFLQLPSTEKLAFVAGQYLEFILKDGRRRAFSIANAPHDSALIELHLRLVSGGQFTQYVFDEMPEKTIMRIEAPLGTFYLREESKKPIIFVAGGTGFAPVKAIIEHMIHNNISREILLYRGGRQPEDLYMNELCERWASFLPNLSYIPVVSEVSLASEWQGRQGLVHQAVLDDYPDLSGFEAYVCGAPGMVEAAHQTFLAQGLNPDAFFSDAFTFAPK
jgi:CDP-4-dehydro-6-deoxyglucose reductase